MKKLKKMASKFFGAVLALAMALTVVPVMEIQANEEKMVTMTVDGTEIDLTSYLRRFTDGELYDHPYVLETALSENPELSFQASEIVDQVTMRCEGINGTSEWRLASDAAPITHHEMSLFKSSMYGNNKYNIDVRIDHKIYYFSIEVKNYTLPSIDALKAKLAEAKAIKEDGYTEESYAELQAVIKSASLTVSMNQNKLWDADQKKFDTRLAELEQAIEQLTLEGDEADKQRLEARIAEAKTYYEGVTYPNPKQEELQKYVEETAQPVADTETDQKVIDQTTFDLAEKILDYVVYDGDLKAASGLQLSYDDGLSQLKEKVAEGTALLEQEMSDDLASDLEKIDQKISEIKEAIAYLKSQETKPEILNAISYENGTLTLELNCRPYSRHSFDILHDGGHPSPLPWEYKQVDGKHLCKNSDPFEEGPQFFLLQFSPRWNNEGAQWSVFRYWISIDEEGHVDYGLANNADAQLVIHAPDGDIVVEADAQQPTVVQLEPGTSSLSAAVSGVLLYDAAIQQDGETIQTIQADGTHEQMEISFADAEGQLSAGTYEIMVRSYRSGAPHDRYLTDTFTIDLQLQEADKSKLQALYDETADYQPENIDGYEKFHEERDEAKQILEDPNASQEDVDKQVIQLEGRYCYVKIQEMEKQYGDAVMDPTSDAFDTLYTSESLKPLMTTYKRYSSYYLANAKVLKQEDVDLMKTMLADYESAIAQLEQVKQTDLEEVGLNQDAMALNKEQGTFTILEKRPIVVDGKIRYELTVRFDNSGIHPIFGESITDYKGVQTKFDRFNGYQNAKVTIQTYDDVFGPKKTSFIPDDAFEKLDPDTSLTRGFVFTTVVDADERYVTFTYTYNLDSSASAGYYYLADNAEILTPINAVPVIVADDVTIDVGDRFDDEAALTFATASDQEDGDLSNQIVVLENTVDPTTEGVYSVTYQVSDSAGATSVKTIQVTVKEPQKPQPPVQVDKSALYELLKQYEGYVSSDYTVESWDPFKRAYDEAVTVYLDAEATQENVDDAYATLKEMAGQLVKQDTVEPDRPQQPEGEDKPEKDPVADTAVQHTGILPYAAFAILSLGAVLYIVNRKRTHE